MIGSLCPECGSRVQRSHARGIKEGLVRTFTRYKAYRCHDCGWRGWFSTGRPSPGGNILRMLIILFTLLLVTFVALYAAR